MSDPTTTDPVALAVAGAFQDAGLDAFPGFLPPSTADDPYGRYPCVTFRQVGGGRSYTHDGWNGLTNPLWEVNCWAMGYGAARTLANEAMNALESVLDAQLLSTHDDREVNTAATRIILTVNVWT